MLNILHDALLIFLLIIKGILKQSLKRDRD